MKELPKRKHPRLKGYNYSRSGAYFITFCVKGGHELLGEIVGRDTLGAPTAIILPYIKLSEYGNIIHKEIEDTYLYYSNISVNKFVVMTNHVHIIAIINNGDGVPRALTGVPRASRPTATIPSFISVLKKKTNKAVGFNIWQDSYHDRIIRNEDEYKRIWQYIDENPAKWYEDRYYKKET